MITKYWYVVDKEKYDSLKVMDLSLNYKVENQNKYPLWDDVSGIFIKLDCVKKEILPHELGKKFLLLALQN